MPKRRGPNYQTSKDIYKELSKKPQTAEELTTNTGLNKNTVYNALTFFQEKGLIEKRKAPKQGQPRRVEYEIIKGQGPIATYEDILWSQYLDQVPREIKRENRRKILKIHKEGQRIYKDFYESEEGKELREANPLIEKLSVGEAYNALLRHRNQALCIKCLENGFFTEVVWKDNEIICDGCAKVLANYDEELLRR